MTTWIIHTKEGRKGWRMIKIWKQKVTYQRENSKRQEKATNNEVLNASNMAKDERCIYRGDGGSYDAFNDHTQKITVKP